MAFAIVQMGETTPMKVSSTIIGSATVAMFFASAGICNAQATLKQEPVLVMQQGTSVLVDDGTCGKGKIKQVTAGNYNAMAGNENRVRKCVPK
jgi:Family of unknown function (DUF6719)